MKVSRVLIVLASILALVLGALGIVNVMTGPSISSARATERSLAVAAEARVAGSDGSGESREPELAGLGPELAAPQRVAMDAPASRAGPRAPNETPVEAAAPVAATPEELREFGEYVDATLAEIRTEKAADRMRDIDRRNAALDGTLRALQAKLGLTPLQADKLRSLLRLQLDREAEYVWHFEQRADEQALAELKANDREIHLRDLSSILTAKQFAAYRN